MSHPQKGKYSLFLPHTHLHRLSRGLNPNHGSILEHKNQEWYSVSRTEKRRHEHYSRINYRDSVRWGGEEVH